MGQYRAQRAFNEGLPNLLLIWRSRLPTWPDGDTQRAVEALPWPGINGGEAVQSPSLTSSASSVGRCPSGRNTGARAVASRRISAAAVPGPFQLAKSVASRPAFASSRH
jgi:hypothetical protein